MTSVPAKGKPLSLFIFASAVFIITFLVFLPARQCGFVNDDIWVLVKNPNIKGFTSLNLGWMFTPNNMPHFFPLTLLTFAFDYSLWGLNAGKFHLTNVLFHSAGAVLFYFFALQFFEAAESENPRSKQKTFLFIGAFFAALFFSLHPLRTESVVYLVERADTLSGIFYIATLMCYFHACAHPPRSRQRDRWRLASLGAFALSLLSKEIGITMPIIMLLLDVYPLRRFRKESRSEILLEKLPFLILSLASGSTVIFTEHINENLIPIRDHWILDRCTQAVYCIIFYFKKTLLPFHLSPFYELPNGYQLLSNPYFLFEAFGLLLVLTASIRFRKIWPAGIILCAYYLVTLGPVLGILKFGPQVLADRYSYLPCLGFALLAGRVIAYIWDHALQREITPPILYGSMILALSVLSLFGQSTRRQIDVWHDYVSWWTRVIEVNPRSHFAETKLGEAYLKDRNFDQAEEHFKRALALNPKYEDALIFTGLTLSQQGKVDEAIEYLKGIIQQVPGSETKIYSHIANILVVHGRPREAIDYYNLVLKLTPDDPGIHMGLATAFFNSGRPQEGTVHLKKALSLSMDPKQRHESLVGLTIRNVSRD